MKLRTLLKQVRETTQAEAARKLRQHQSFVSKCESGERRVDVVELERFATLYQLDLASFLER